MNKKIRIVSYCLLAFISFSVSAQQRPLLTDTTAIPELEEQTRFASYNYMLKSRLDSIQRTVPLTYNEYVQEYIDIYAGRKDMMGKMLGLSDYYSPIFSRALKSYDIPDEIKYLPIIESSLNPHAVSRVGATGLWQFMYTTAKGYGLGIDNYVDERKDPVQSSYAAAAYFRDAFEELGDWLLAIAAYNCGMGGVKRAMQKAESNDFWVVRKFLPQETRNYVPAFIATVYVMKCWKKHDIELKPSALARQADTVHVNHFVSLPKLAQALSIPEEDLLKLNPSYKKKIVNGTMDAPRRVVVPRVAVADYAAVYDVLNGGAESGHKVVFASSPGYTIHKVTRGQNLGAIADKYRVEVQDLKFWNNLKSTVIVPGQKLKVYRPDEEPAGKLPLKS
ncbi:lytic transglycosylase domain-containing protein [Pedobacter deserti]|uniref:lytic transglycosylase domain-containing protein n=1 Tax=Pedobacter deserti TaxID=2817382 RepID=UPI00210B981C|nr:lytic transglycosylase domain-containing protein [Pedobacter sp. SYSU D00382]